MKWKFVCNLIADDGKVRQTACNAALMGWEGSGESVFVRDLRLDKSVGIGKMGFLCVGQWKAESCVQ